jgi:hypothetical protein
MMKLTTNHAASSYGQPVLVDESGTAYGQQDVLPNGQVAMKWVRAELENCDARIARGEKSNIEVDCPPLELKKALAMLGTFAGCAGE